MKLMLIEIDVAVATVAFHCQNTHTFHMIKLLIYLIGMRIAVNKKPFLEFGVAYIGC